MRWRVWYLSNHLNKMGHNSKWMHLNDPSYRTECLTSDVVVFYRCYANQSDFIKELKSRGVLVLYDIDDYVFQPKGKYNTPRDVEMIGQYFKDVDFYMASTSKLSEMFPYKNKPVIVRENCIDDETFNLLSKKKSSKNLGGFRIGWLTGINRTEMLSEMYNLLNMINNRCGKVHFYYFGVMNEFYKNICKLNNINVHRLNYINTGKWKDLYRMFRLCNFDVVINPLHEDDVFMHCKSNLKFIETGCMGVPLITSRLGPFTDVIEDGINGLLASNNIEFVDKINFIKNNPDKAFQIGSNAKQTVQDNYLINITAPVFVNKVYEFIILANNKKSHYIKESSYSPDVGQSKVKFISNEINKPLSIIFKSQQRNLSRFEIMMNRAKNVHGSAFKVLFRNKTNNNIIFEKIYAVKNFCESGWWKFDFPKVVDSADKYFEVSLIPLNIHPGHGFRMYYTTKSDDIFINGELKAKYFINGVQQSGAPCFQTYCNINSNTRTHKDNVQNTAIDFNNKSKILVRIDNSVNYCYYLFPVLDHIKAIKNCEIIVASPHSYHFNFCNSVDRVAGYKDKIVSTYSFDISNCVKLNPQSHPTDVFANKILGFSDFHKDIILKVSEESKTNLNKIKKIHNLINKKYIVLHKSILESNKNWPKEKWTRLEAHLLSSGYQVVVIGFGSDHGVSMPNSVNLLNKLSPVEIKLLIDDSRALITNDSLSLLISSQCNVKKIGLFFSTIPKLRLPYNKDIISKGYCSIKSNIDCFGCCHNQKPPVNYSGCARKDFACLDLITPRRVLEVLNR